MVVMKSTLRAVLITLAVWVVLGSLAMIVSASIFGAETREGKMLYLALGTVAGLIGIVVFNRLSTRPLNRR